MKNLGFWCLLMGVFFGKAASAQSQSALQLGERVVAIGDVGLSAVIDQSSPVIGCGQPVTLSATVTGAMEISWKRNGEFINGATTSAFIANQPGIYSVVAISLLCQIESTPVQVILESPLNAVIVAPNGLEACAGVAVELQAAGGNAQWQWYRNGVALSEGTTALYSAFLPGEYIVIGNESSICASTSQSVQVVIHPLPVVQLTWAETPLICPGDSATILSSNAANEQVIWYHDESIVDGGNSQLTATLAGEYHAWVTNTNTGCNNWSNSLYLDLWPTQSIEIATANPSVLCEGESATLVANDVSGSIRWYLDNMIMDGVLGAAATIYSSGNYTAGVTDENGCTSFSNTFSFEILPLPVVSLLFDEPFPVLCGEDDTLILYTSTGSTYVWYSQDGQIAGEDAYAIAITVPGTYAVEAMGTNGCRAISQALEVVAYDSPELTLAPAGIVNVCEGQFQLFEAFSSSPAQFEWYLNGELIEGETGLFLEASASGFYQVVLTDENGCGAFSEAADLAFVVVNTPIIEDGGIQVEGWLLLTEEASGHQWYLNGEEISGATGNSYLATEDGFYSCIAIEDICESSLSSGYEVVLGGVLEGSIAMKLFPNPAEDFIVFENSLLMGSTFAIYDVAGREVLSGVTTNSRMTVDVSNLGVGMYRLVFAEGEQGAFSVVR